MGETSTPKIRARSRLKPRSGPKPPPSAEAARHGGAPVRLDAELGGVERERLAVGRERDRRALQRRRPRGEQADGLRLRHPADVDACDRGAGSELRLRPGEREPEEQQEHAKDHPEEDGPAQGNPAGGLAHARAVDRRIAAHRTEDFSGAAHPRELANGRGSAAEGPSRRERLKPLPGAAWAR